LAELADGYDVILCDVWGVLHNGAVCFPEAAKALGHFRARGGAVVLITNAPNPSHIVRAHLDRLGAPRAAYDSIVSSGDVTVALLIARAAAALFHIGPAWESALFEEVSALTGKTPRFAPLDAADFVLCTGLADPAHEAPADYDARLAQMLPRGLEFICANPDIVVQDGDKLAYCAGAIAERYAALGGKVIQAGKPFPPIYERALSRARERRGGELDRKRVLAIGDAMRTDIKGACDQGLASLFVTSGIHREELYGGAEGASLDAAALRQFAESAGFAPTAAIAELVWQEAASR
jgi:HAD superfamily hydrolase (TIGR01459 family)